MKKTPHFHELTSDIRQAFLSIIKDRGALPENEYIEENKLHHCRTKTHSEKKYFWYRIGFSPDEHAFIGKFGSRDPKDGGSVPFPVYDEALTPEQQARQAEAEQERQQQAQAKAEQERQQAQKEAAKQARGAEQTAALAARILAAGADILPECLQRKGLPLVSPGKGMYGRDLIRLLPSSQRFVKSQVLKIPNFSGRVFGVYPAYGKNGELRNIQINLPEKIFFRPDDKKPADKLFLAGKGTKTGAFLALTPLSDIPNGSELHVCEGYAKAIPLHMAGKYAVIAFDAGNIPNVIDYFAPSVYATADDWKNKRRAQTYPRQFTVVHAADSDESGMKTAKDLLRRGVTSVFPVYPLCKDWDDLCRAAGLEEVKRQVETPRDVTGKHYAITQQQYISDLKLQYPALSWLISDTGNGKTREVCRYADENPKDMTVLIAPTVFIAIQTAKDLKKAGKPFQLVLGKSAIQTGASMGLTVSQEYQYDMAGLTVTTLAKFVESFDFTGTLYPVTLFCDEVHGFSEDIYRQFDIMRLTAMFPNARKIILMTATPYFLHSFGLQAAPRIYIEKAGKQPTPCRLLWYKDEYAVIKHFAAQGRVIVEMNNKNALKVLAKTLRSQGFSGVYILTAEEKKAGDPVFQHIAEYERLPKDCRILLTTKLYECGVNIRDTDISACLMFPAKRANVDNLPAAMPTPHAFKQFVNRTRENTPQAFYCLPARMKPTDEHKVGYFDGGRKYRKFRRDATTQIDDWQEEITTFGSEKARFDFDRLMKKDAVSLLSWDYVKNAPVLSETGLDMAVCESYQKTLFHIPYLKEELNAHSLRFEGEIDIESLTSQGESTKQERQAIQSAKQEISDEDLEQFRADVVQMAGMNDKELKRQTNEHAEKLAFLREMASPQDAAAILLKIGRQKRAFSQLRRRLLLLKTLANYTTAGKHVETAASLMAFVKRGEFTGKEAKEEIARIYSQDKIMRHHLDENWKTGARSISEKHAISVLRNFADFETKHTEAGNVQTVTDSKPVFTLWKEVTDQTPLQSIFFQKWFFEKSQFSESKTPTEQGKTPDTLQNDFLIREAKINVSGLIDFISENYAEEQIRIYGNVF